MLTLIHIRLAVMTSELKSVNLKRCRFVVKILVCAKEALSELITSTLSPAVIEDLYEFQYYFKTFS